MKILAFSYLFSFFAFTSSSFAQSAEDLIQEGDKFNKEFDHQRSLESYLKADELSPSNWEIIWRISRSYVDIGNKMPEDTDEEMDAKIATYEKSFLYADSAVNLAENQSVVYVRRAIVNGRIALFEGVFSAIGTVNDVRDDCERAIELNNGGNYVQALAHYVLGRAHAKVCEKPYLLRLPIGLGWGDMEDAIRELENAIKLKPNYRMFYLELAKAHIEEGNYALAKENLLLLEKAPFILEDDDLYLQEGRKLLIEVNEELD